MARPQRRRTHRRLPLPPTATPAVADGAAGSPGAASRQPGRRPTDSTRARTASSVMRSQPRRTRNVVLATLHLPLNRRDGTGQACQAHGCDGTSAWEQQERAARAWYQVLGEVSPTCTNHVPAGPRRDELGDHHARVARIRAAAAARGSPWRDRRRWRRRRPVPSSATPASDGADGVAGLAPQGAHICLGVKLKLKLCRIKIKMKLKNKTNLKLTTPNWIISVS